jgi:hypothetical protein
LIQYKEIITASEKCTEDLNALRKHTAGTFNVRTGVSCSNDWRFRVEISKKAGDTDS